MTKKKFRTDAEVDAHIDAEIEKEAKKKAKEQKEKQRMIIRGNQLMADIRQLEQDFKQEKVRANLACQKGDFVEAERIIKAFDTAMKTIRGK